MPKKDPTFITATLMLDTEYLADIINTANVRYWGRVRQLTRKVAGSIERSPIMAWHVFETENNDPTEPFIINATTLAHGIQRLAQVAPMQLAALLARKADATTGDVLVQLAAFDEVRYA